MGGAYLVVLEVTFERLLCEDGWLIDELWAQPVSRFFGYSNTPGLCNQRQRHLYGKADSGNDECSPKQIHRLRHESER